MTGQAPSIALVTAARNEEANLGRTLASVVAQTVRPRRWVVVSDGSTDATDALALAWTRLEERRSPLLTTAAPAAVAAAERATARRANGR